MRPTIIRIGAAPEKFAFTGQFFDGLSPVLHRVELAIDDTAPVAALQITGTQAEIADWPLADLRCLPDQAGNDGIVLQLLDDPVKRLILRDPDANARLLARCPEIGRKPPVKGLRRIWAWSAGAVASVALIIFVLVPVMADQLAEYLPPEGERALGAATFEQIRNALGVSDFEPIGICDRPRSLTALAKLQDRLTVDLDLPYPVTLQVLDDPMVNAFALPGGYVVLIRGLIETAESPDELASVMAHELGHVVARDPTRYALRSAGSIGVLGLLLGDFAGGIVVLFLAEQLIQATYSQNAEQAADGFGSALLAKAGIAPGAMADMFERLESDAGEPDASGNSILAHFESHPQIRDRIESARAEAKIDADSYSPGLSPADWRELRMICGKSYSF